MLSVQTDGEQMSSQVRARNVKHHEASNSDKFGVDNDPGCGRTSVNGMTESQSWQLTQLYIPIFHPFSHIVLLYKHRVQ